MTIRGVAATLCLASLVFAWGCAKDDAPVTQSTADTPSLADKSVELDKSTAEDTPAKEDTRPTEDATPAEDTPVIEDSQPEDVPPAAKDTSSGLSVASKGNVAPDLVGTWVLEMTGFEDMEFPGLSEEDLADLPDDAEAMAGFAEMMSGMMGMFGGMKDTYVLNADGTFVKTTTMGFGGEVGGVESVMEGVWSANEGWLSLYIMRMVSNVPGQDPKVREFADATLMPPMAMKLAEDRKTFVDGATIGMEMGGITVLYRKQPADD